MADPANRPAQGKQRQRAAGRQLQAAARLPAAAVEVDRDRVIVAVLRCADARRALMNCTEPCFAAARLPEPRRRYLDFGLQGLAWLAEKRDRGEMDEDVYAELAVRTIVQVGEVLGSLGVNRAAA